MCWRASRGSLLRVLVVGAGGLGSPAIMYLAGAGVGSLTVVDPDVVEASNLHRQPIHAGRVGWNKAESARAFVQALDRTRAAIAEASVVIDMIDVGGGFPSAYPGLEPPPMEDYFAIIARHFEALPIAYNAELWCEPGRALSAEYSSMIVQVNKRRGEELYINDGAYGALYDAAHVAWRFPVRALEDDLIEENEDFAFYGPPDIQAGDYIEIGMLGAYGAAMKTGFNGYGNAQVVTVQDEPMMSLFNGTRVREATDNVVSLR